MKEDNFQVQRIYDMKTSSTETLKPEKMNLGIDEVQELDDDDCDASTVINQRIHRDEVEVVTTEEPASRVEKVTEWLEKSCVLAENKALEDKVSDWMLNIKSPGAAEWIFCNARRVKVILMNVSPSIDGEPLDFVCGHCSEGHEHFPFTKLHWERTETPEGSEIAPYCPSCFEMGINVRATLFFMIKLNVVDSMGTITTILVYKEFAEQFMGCTAEEFVKASAVRRSKIQLLSKLMQLEEVNYVPLLDLLIVLYNDKAHLISCRLN